MATLLETSLGWLADLVGLLVYRDDIPLPQRRRYSFDGDSWDITDDEDNEVLRLRIVHTLTSYTVVQLETIYIASSHAQEIVYVSNEVGGAQPAFSDGTNWRKFSDRAIIAD